MRPNWSPSPDAQLMPIGCRRQRSRQTFRSIAPWPKPSMLTRSPRYRGRLLPKGCAVYKSPRREAQASVLRMTLTTSGHRLRRKAPWPLPDASPPGQRGRRSGPIQAWRIGRDDARRSVRNKRSRWLSLRHRRSLIVGPRRSDGESTMRAIAKSYRPLRKILHVRLRAAAIAAQPALSTVACEARPRGKAIDGD